MIFRRVALASLVAVVGCSGKNDPAPSGGTSSTKADGSSVARSSATPSSSSAPATDKSGTPVAGRATLAAKVDKTASQDGGLTGDSADDGVVSLSIAGPVSALALVTVDASGVVDKLHQWDTVVEDQVIPKAWDSGFDVGASTLQLGVEEGGKALNAKNGSLTPLGEGPHALTLYFGDASLATPGMKFVVLAERPDHSVVKSNVFAM